MSKDNSALHDHLHDQKWKPNALEKIEKFNPRSNEEIFRVLLPIMPKVLIPIVLDYFASLHDQWEQMFSLVKTKSKKGIKSEQILLNSLRIIEDLESKDEQKNQAMTDLQRVIESDVRDLIYNYGLHFNTQDSSYRDMLYFDLRGLVLQTFLMLNYDAYRIDSCYLLYWDFNQLSRNYYASVYSGLDLRNHRRKWLNGKTSELVKKLVPIANFPGKFVVLETESKTKVIIIPPKNVRILECLKRAVDEREAFQGRHSSDLYKQAKMIKDIFFKGKRGNLYDEKIRPKISKNKLYPEYIGIYKKALFKRLKILKKNSSENSSYYANIPNKKALDDYQSLIFALSKGNDVFAIINKNFDARLFFNPLEVLKNLINNVSHFAEENREWNFLPLLKDFLKLNQLSHGVICQIIQTTLEMANTHAVYMIAVQGKMSAELTSSIPSKLQVMLENRFKQPIDLVVAAEQKDLEKKQKHVGCHYSIYINKRYLDLMNWPAAHPKSKVTMFIFPFEIVQKMVTAIHQTSSSLPFLNSSPKVSVDDLERSLNMLGIPKEAIHYLYLHSDNDYWLEVESQYAEIFNELLLSSNKFNIDLIRKELEKINCSDDFQDSKSSLKSLSPSASITQIAQIWENSLEENLDKIKISTAGSSSSSSSLSSSPSISAPSDFWKRKTFLDNTNNITQDSVTPKKIKNTNFFSPSSYSSTFVVSSNNIFSFPEQRLPVKSHDGLFPCSICGIELPAKFRLNRHMKMHRGYQCNQCDQTFLEKSELKRHKLEHESILSCERCDRGNLIDHQRFCVLTPNSLLE